MTPQQIDQLTSALTIGADRLTAAHYLGLSAEELEEHIRADPKVCRAVEQAEASAELTHMRNLFTAAEGEKHWRASVWWLESRNPDKYSRKSGNVTTTDLRAFTEQLCTEILQAVPSEKRDEILQKLESLISQMEIG